MTELIECPLGNRWCTDHDFEGMGDGYQVCRGDESWSAPLDASQQRPDLTPRYAGPISVQAVAIMPEPGAVWVNGVAYTPEGTRELISLLQAALEAVETCPRGTEGCYSHETEADGTFVCRPRNVERHWPAAGPTKGLALASS